MLDVVSVPQAAELLALSPSRVQALIAQGRIPATKIGGRWLIERAALERRQRERGPSGRPFAPHNAWALLRLASGETGDELDSGRRSRLRRAIARDGLEELRPRLTRRAESRHFSAHPGEIAHVLADPALIRSGVSAAGELGLDLVAGPEADGYLRAGALEQFVADHALRPAGASGNVRLRLVPDSAWELLSGAIVAPTAAVALDLAEDPDPRSSRAGLAALNELRKQR